MGDPIWRRRWRRFRGQRRAWTSLVLLAIAFAASLCSPLWISDRALAVWHDGHLRIPVLEGHIEAKELGQRVIGEARYRELADQYAREGTGDWVLLPPYPFSPNESLLREPDLHGPPPHAPSRRHWMGTDDRGRDVFARLVYGFRLSMGFALGLVALSTALGIGVGAVLGWSGGAVDFVGMRLVEIWAGLPFLYTVMIASATIRPTVVVLLLLLALFGWVGTALYVRAEVLRERSRDYVVAAIALGEPGWSIVVRYVLPNALTPVITLAPFAVIGAIGSLVSLDYLGFGVQPPTPSWGELVNQGLRNLRHWHLVLFPIGALFTTLLMVSFVGDAVRDALDPRTEARLR